jgi:hypothetical protein
MANSKMLRKSAIRHAHHRVTPTAILGGLHHEYRLEKVA